MVDAIGIDAGSYKTVLACVKQRGIEIVLSETSEKVTPTVCGFTDQERVIGAAAVNQQKRNFKNSIQFFSRFLGLNQDCIEQINEEKKFITYKVVELENKKIGFEVKCRGETHQFTPEQVTGFYLKKVKTYFEKAGLTSNEVVIAVPTYASNSERQAYLDAAEIAGIKCIRLINESTAIALTYGFFRKNDLNKEKARIVAFVDFGHSKLTVSYASFKPGKMKILGTHSNKNLGARQIDYLLTDLFGGKFEKKYGCDPRKDPRARLRLLDAIEKMRKLLTGNKEADVNCESLMEDEDLKQHFTREEFEELIQPFVKDFTKCLTDSMESTGVKLEEIDFVELVGEATRIPCCIAQIKEVFGKDPSRTLNSTDCISRGCALQAAMLSPNFQVANFEVEENNQQPISISYKFKDSEKVVTKELFKKGSSYPSTKSVTFEKKLGNVNLMVHYSDNAELMTGLPNQIANYQIGEGKLKDNIDKFSFTMRVSNNIHNIACLDEAEFCQEWQEEEKIPIKASPVTVPKKEEPKKEEPKKEEAPKEGAEAPKEGAEAPKEGEEAPKEGAEAPKEETKAEAGPTEPPVVTQPEQKFEIKMRNKKNFSKLKFQSSSYALAPNVRREFKEIEDKLREEDFQILEKKRLKNDLEAYSYDMRNNLDSYGTLEKYLEESKKTTFMAEINQVVEWLYADGDDAPAEEYSTKLAKFKAIGDPVKQRHFYYSELDVYYSQWDKINGLINSKLVDIAHLTDSQKELITKKQSEAATLIAGVKAEREAKQLYENPSYSLDQIENSMITTKKETEAIFNLPPPKPKVEEEVKKDVPMEESKPAEGEGAEAPATEQPAEKKDDAEMTNEEGENK